MHFGKINIRMIKTKKYPAKTFWKIIPIVLFALFSSGVKGSAPKSDSLRFDVLLSGKMLKDSRLNDQFINSLDITSGRLVLLSGSQQLYLLGWGGMEPLGKKVSGNIGDYAFTAEGLLMIVRNRELCGIDSLGNLFRLHKLPGEGMGISAGKNVMYVYDRSKGKIKYALYAIVKGGKYAKLFDVPSPILSAVEMKNAILFATENGLFSYNIKGRELKALAALPKGKEIRSITTDTLNNRIYFSSENALYALKGSSTVTITNEFGGILRFFNDGLLVFNPGKQLLIRIAGVDHVIASTMIPPKVAVKTKQAADTLTNASILDMVKVNLTDDLIIKIINRSETNFNMSVDSMILLSNQHVSSVVILAMKNAMKRKIKNDPN